MKFTFWPYVMALRPRPRTRPPSTFSLKIFFSETTIPRKLIFYRDVPWVGLFKFCSPRSGIPNIFRTGSEKPRKTEKTLKIFFSRTATARVKQTMSKSSLRDPFSSLFKATSCDRYFSRYSSESSEVWTCTISMAYNFLTVGFREEKYIDWV